MQTFHGQIEEISLQKKKKNRAEAPQRGRWKIGDAAPGKPGKKGCWGVAWRSVAKAVSSLKLALKDVYWTE